MSTVLKRSAEVLKLQNKYEMAKMKAQMAYDAEVEREVESWHIRLEAAAIEDIGAEISRHNKRVGAINKRRQSHLAALKDWLLAGYKVVKFKQQMETSDNSLNCATV